MNCQIQYHNIAVYLSIHKMLLKATINLIISLNIAHVVNSQVNGQERIVGRDKVVNNSLCATS